jgi:excisionase family DNA binding protein
MSEIAELFGVSDDTVRRWADSGQLTAVRDGGGRKAVEGVELAAFAKSQAHATRDPSLVDRSARNRFVGLVTDVIADRVMAQVEIQCGPHRVVSLMSSEAVRELGGGEVDGGHGGDPRRSRVRRQRAVRHDSGPA